MCNIDKYLWIWAGIEQYISKWDGIISVGSGNMIYRYTHTHTHIKYTHTLLHIPHANTHTHI